MAAQFEFPEHSVENRRIWDANARWWDDRIGGGNDFQTLLIEPATERLLAVSAGDRILDIACGAGRFARRMAELGARVVAFDCSAKFIERARERGRPVIRSGVKVSSYLSPFARKTEGIIGQPEPQWYFHRPIHVLFQTGFSAGFVVDGIEEPRLPDPQKRKAGVRWDDMPQIPPILVARMRLK